MKILNWIVLLPTLQSFILRIITAFTVFTGVLPVGSAILKMVKTHTTPDISQLTTALVISRPYRFTRNPIYLGFFLIYLGFTLLTGMLWGILLSPFLF